MSEQAVDNTEAASEVAETAVESPQVVDTHESNDSHKPAGYDPVDLSDLPPEKQKILDDRINYLYRQVKDGGRTLGEYRAIAQQQATKIDELMNGMGIVAEHLQQKSYQDSEADIRQKMQAAFEKGDTATYLSEQERLIDIKAQAKVAKNQPRQQQTQQPQQKVASPQEITNQAIQGGELTPQDATYVGAWQDEKDTSGAPLRPWAHDTDPNYRAALLETASVFNNPGFARMSFQDKLAEVDRRMGVKKSNGNQAVMGGSLQSPRKNGNIRLTPQQERIAVKTNFGGKGKTDAEHIAAYRKQIESVQSRTQRSR